MSLDGMKRENLARRGRGSGNGKFGFVFGMFGLAGIHHPTNQPCN